MISQISKANHGTAARSFAALALAWLALGSGCAPDPRPFERRVSPQDPASPFEIPPAGEIGADTARFQAAARYSVAHGGHALLVVDGDEVVFAVGQNGHAVDDAHPLNTATASFWGPTAVVAEIDGLLSLDELVSSSISEFKGVRNKQDLRIRHLLQYTSGLESGVWPLIREQPSNRYQAALSLEMVAPPGERFQFGPSHLTVFGELMRRKLAMEGMDALDYLRRRIFEPIGLELSRWERDAAGNPDLFRGATLSAREWAKFGVFVRDGGYWRGEVIVDPVQLANCFEGSAANPGFGLTFWLDGGASASGRPRNAAPRPGLPDLVAAMGTGNQRLYAIRSLDLVVVRFGEEDDRWRDRDFLALLAIPQPPGGYTQAPSD